GIGVSPDGQEVDIALRVGLSHYTPEGKFISNDYVGPPGFEPGVKLRNGERNRPCRLVTDNNGDIYGIQPADFFGEEGGAFKITKTGLELYQLNRRNDARAVAVDNSDNGVFVLNSSFSGGDFEMFDENGRLLGKGWGVPDAGHSYEGITLGASGITV